MCSVYSHTFFPNRLKHTVPFLAVYLVQELLVATRHVLATDFKRGFFTQIDTLLDERYTSLFQAMLVKNLRLAKKFIFRSCSCCQSPGWHRTGLL